MAHIALAQKDVAALRRADLREAGGLEHLERDAVGVVHVRDDLLKRLRRRQLLHSVQHRLAPAVPAAGGIDEKVVDEHRLGLGRVSS